MNDDYVAPGTGKTLSTSSLIACGAFAGLLLLYVCTHACTGFAVDIVLYPIDTVKTRLQSERGFKNSGGFRRIYAGVPSILVGSAPSAALFFTAYETIKHVAGDTPPAHMLAAMMGEVAACFVRVPTEVVKQRSQVGQLRCAHTHCVKASPNLPTGAVLHRLYIADGVGGLYRGFGSTILREIPFSVIEFPLWEAFKRRTSQYTGKPLTSIQVRVHAHR
jgi:solute carrier family 25 S-adenosylmethionine transporter 26